MSGAVFYPQAAMILRVVWEDYQLRSDARLAQVYTMPILAKRLSIEINDYTQADTFSAEIDFKNFPFDPRTVRALGVTIHAEDMKKLYRDDGSPLLIEPRDDNVVFQGFADKESISMDENERVVKFDGRDFTGLLIDTPFDIGTVPLTTPLETLLGNIVKSLAATEKVQVVNRTGEVLPTLGQFAPDFNALSGHKNTKKGESYWDVIQDVVARAGLIAFIELDKLVISKPRVLYDKTNARRFIYGVNLKSLEFERKLGRQKGFNIAVRSLDVEGKSVLEAKIPEEASAEWSNSIGIKREPVKIEKLAADGTKTSDTAPYITFRVADMRNKEQLIKVGEKIFEEVGRQQIEGKLQTHDMATTQDGVRFEMLKVRNGTPISILIDQGDMEGLSTLTSESERFNFLKKRGYEQGVAMALARVYGKMPMIFYTKSASFTFDTDVGFGLSLEFINFIELTERLLSA